MNKTTKILVWAIGILILFNVSILATFYCKYIKSAPENGQIVLDENLKNPLNGRFFRHTIGFDDKQMETFRSASQTFQPEANSLIIEINKLKKQLFEEVNEENPDTLEIKLISEHIGQHHAELKQLTNKFYIKLKTVCTPKQAEQLKQLFQPLYQDESINSRRAYRHQNDSTFRRGQKHGAKQNRPRNEK